MSQRLPDDQIDRGLTALPGWQRAGDVITGNYAMPTFPVAIALVERVADRGVEELLRHGQFEPVALLRAFGRGVAWPDLGDRQ